MNNRQREENLTLEILEAIDAQSDVTQRHLARRTGIALGLANSYLKRCVRKGLVKIQQAPANRYLYYLTPKGFAEKSRLTAQYLSYSFTFYRRAAESCAEAIEDCKARGWNRIVLCGASDLAEIASIRALEHGIEIVCVYEPKSDKKRFLTHRVIGSISQPSESDGWMLTDLEDPQAAYIRLAEQLPVERIIVPSVLGFSVPELAHQNRQYSDREARR
jgi:predicted transcriptional regulator